MNRILIVGVPRSGTTWVATVLSKCKDTYFFNEPDDERRFSVAAEAKTYLTRYPSIAPGDRLKVGEAYINDYRLLWEKVWGVDVADNVIAKSVFVPFCLEWLRETFGIQSVLWVVRDILNTVASWYEYSRTKHPEIADEILVRRLAWEACRQYSEYRRLVSGKAISIAVDHRFLAQEQDECFPRLAEELGLEWTHEAHEQLSDLNSFGVGGHYGQPGYNLEDHIRRTQEQIGPDAWKNKMSVDLANIVAKEARRWGIDALTH